MKNKNTKCNTFRAFTLIELLIVISIVLILTTIGVTSFSAARKNLTIDLETDKLVSIMHTLRNETRAGSKCLGLVFMKNKPVQKSEAAYKNPVEGCDVQQITPLPISSEIVASNIAIDNRKNDTLSVVFVPPFGTISFSPLGEIGEIEFMLKNVGANIKKLRINKVTGSIEKTNNI